MSTTADELRAVLADDRVLWEVARRAVEDELIEMRDAGLYVLGSNNGFTVNFADGTPGPLRLPTFDGIKVALRALIEHYDSEPIRTSSEEPK